MTQRILNASENYAELDAYLRETGAERVLLVCDSALPFLRISGYFDATASSPIRFMNRRWRACGFSGRRAAT